MLVHKMNTSSSFVQEPAMPPQPRLIAFWCHWCGEQVIEDHPVAWTSPYCRSCSLKLGTEMQENEQTRYLS